MIDYAQISLDDTGESGDFLVVETVPREVDPQRFLQAFVGGDGVGSGAVELDRHRARALRDFLNTQLGEEDRGTLTIHGDLNI
jgi:hypothetical protein